MQRVSSTLQFGVVAAWRICKRNGLRLVTQPKGVTDFSFVGEAASLKRIAIRYVLSAVCI